MLKHFILQCPHSKTCWLALTQNLGQIWTNPNVGLKNVQFKVKVEIIFLTQHLGLSIFYPIFGLKQPSIV